MRKKKNINALNNLELPNKNWSENVEYTDERERMLYNI